MNQEILSLKRSSPDFDLVLMRGSLTRHGEPCLAFPREVISNSKEIEAVIFEIVRRVDIVKPSVFRIWWKAIRPESLTVILTPSLAVLLNGLVHYGSVSWGMAALALFGVLFFQIAVNALNDVEDHLRLLDLPHRKGGSGVIQKGWLSAEQLQRFGFGCFGVGALLGLLPVLENPGILAAVGGVGALGVVSYSNRPIGIKYRAWGDLSIFFLLGPLLCIGLSQASFGKVDLSTIILGLFSGFTTYGIYHAKNIQNGLKENGLFSSVGFKSSRHIFIALYGLAYISLFFGILDGTLPWSVAFGLFVGLPWVIQMLRRVYKASGPNSALLVFLREDALKLHFWLGALVCLSLLFSLFVNSHLYFL